jgi:hypothetical protein
VWICSAAAIISSTVSQSAPTSGVISSGSAPRWVPSTGVPDRNASIVTRPNGSSHAAGFHRHRARASSAALVAPSTSPTNLIDPVKLGRQPPATMSRWPVRFAASTAQ